MTWEDVLKEEVEKPYFKKLGERVKNDRKVNTVFPETANILRAFELTPFEKIKVVILGQDPYHGEGQAHGLSFSVTEGNKLPPSLRNIFKELKDDLGIENTIGDLTPWAKQGVFLLNAILTVAKNKPGSHSNLGWENFTSFVIKQISDKRDRVVFVLWGKFAKSKKVHIDTKKHLVLESSHPSPFSAAEGFFGSKPFSKINEIYNIDWKTN